MPRTSQVRILLFVALAHQRWSLSVVKGYLPRTRYTTFQYACRHQSTSNPDLPERIKGRSWNRLRHLVDLANPCRSIADIGTDHGLLAFALARSGHFEHVIGIDCSIQALTDGAFALPKLSNLEFRHADGIKGLTSGEADTLCLAGIGVETMTEILLSNTKALNELQCQRLVLQPTNSRPRNLIRLYERLHAFGWTVQDERIEYQGRRWYVTSAFGTVSSMEPFVPARVPGTTLDDSNKDYATWVSHHRNWLEQDLRNGFLIKPEDSKWLDSLDIA